MANKNIYVEDFYQTTLQNDLSSSGDLEIQVSVPPKNKQGFLILTPENQSTREGVYYHNVDGNTIYVKEINRRELKEHYSGEKIQINDTSLIFNYLSEVSYTAFYAEKTGDLSVKIWGGTILKGLEELELADTNLDLTDDATNYVYIDTIEYIIKVATSAPTSNGIVVGEITTAGGKITSIAYKKHGISIGNFIQSIAKTDTNGLTDTYTITLSDGNTITFDVVNGKGIDTIDKTNTDVLKDTYTITYNDGTTTTFDVTNGRSVDSIDKTDTTGLTDTYTITYNDNTTSTYTVTNGHDIKFKGTYDETVDYVKYDAVYYDYKTYVAIADTTGNEPTDTNYWQIMVSGDVVSLPSYTISNATEDREFDADDYTTDELADVLATFINDVTVGLKGNDGEDGLGVPAGGTTGQILAKKSDDDNDTEWKDKEQGGHILQDEGTDLTTRPKLDFVGDGVVVTDDSDNDKTIVTVDISGKEDAFTKNTGFNKDFGTDAGTVSEGNHNHNLADLSEKSYDSLTDKPDLSVYQTTANMIDEDDMASNDDTKYPTQQSVKAYVDNKNYTKIETVMIAGEQVAGTKIFEYNADSDKTVGNVKISLEVANEGADFIVKAYKNGTDLDKDITIADGGGDAVNDRYVASSDIAETLANTDVFELKIDQVGSDVAGSDFLALINIT